MPPSAVIAGSGPNGLAAAIVLARAGFKVLVREASAEIGGGARSAELTLPGFIHDLGSAVHPFGVASPFFSSLSLEGFGLQWVFPPAELAHPFDDGTAVTLEREVGETATQLGRDAAAYRNLFSPLVGQWDRLRGDLLGPVHWPQHPLAVARLGLKGGILGAGILAMARFREPRARALFAGLAAHSFLPLSSPMSAPVGLMLGVAAHATGWPIPKGGAQRISNALQQCLRVAGGETQTRAPVRTLDEVKEHDLILLDVTPRQLLAIGRDSLPATFRVALRRFRYGPGVFKMDWALREPIPWRARECLRAGTVHLGGRLEEIAASERAPWNGRVESRPFVLLAQPTLFDPSRAPAGRHVAWAYCHVPNGWAGSAQEAIENQIERFAPGFRECILERSVMNTAQMQAWNANLVGGEINGGAFSGLQLFLRPTWRLYGTPLSSVYLCSSSTPPGGGVHGMCGYWAAQRALREHPQLHARVPRI